MKVSKRTGSKAGTLPISIAERQIERVNSALAHLERVNPNTIMSRHIQGLIEKEAMRLGWAPPKEAK